MPLVMRLSGRIPAGSVNTDMLTNVDFAPTFLDSAGLEKPAAMQGKSFLPLASGRRLSGWPASVYYHYYEYPAVHMVKRHYGVRTARYKLIRFYHDIDAWELYDLKTDPRELHNVYADPDYAKVRRELEIELGRLQELYGDSEERARLIVETDLKR